MGTHGVVVDEVGTQEPAQMGLIENEEVVEALAAEGPDEAFHVGPRGRGAVLTSRIPRVWTRLENTTA